MENQNMNMMKSLRDRAKEFDARLPLMEGREKGETEKIMGQVSTLNDYGFLPNEAGEMYVVFTILERPNQFFFGGSVLTARMVELDQDGYGEAIRTEGLPILLTQTKSRKSGRSYVNVQFYPEG